MNDVLKNKKRAVLLSYLFPCLNLEVTCMLFSCFTAILTMSKKLGVFLIAEKNLLHDHKCRISEDSYENTMRSGVPYECKIALTRVVLVFLYVNVREIGNGTTALGGCWEAAFC